MALFVRYKGRKQGPLNDAQLATLLKRGTLDQDTEASVDEQDWKPLKEFPEFERLQSAPPKAPATPKPDPAPEAQSSDEGAYALSDIPLVVPTRPVSFHIQKAMQKKLEEEEKALEEKPSVFKKLLEKPHILYGTGFALVLLVIVGLVFSRSGFPAKRSTSSQQGSHSSSEPNPHQHEPQTNEDENRKREIERQEKIEAEKRAAEQKEKDDFAKVPVRWLNPDRQPLRNSASLWDIKDRVTLKYIPFLSLESEKIVIRESEHCIEFHHDNGQGIFGISKSSILAALELQKNGIVFQWKQRSTDAAQRRALNSIFLSRMQIRVEGIGEKEISLWTPVEHHVSETKRPALDGEPFVLWRYGDPGFNVNNGNVRLVLDFPSEIPAELMFTISKTVELQNEICYAPTIKVKKEDRSVIDVFFRVAQEISPALDPAKTDQLQFMICNDEIEYFINDIDNLKKQLRPKEEEKNNKYKEFTASENRMKNNQLQYTSLRPPKKLTALEETSSIMREKYQTALRYYHNTRDRLKKKQQKEQTHYKSLKTEIDSIKADIDGLEKQILRKIAQIKETREEMGQIHLKEAPFSIYLLKSGTEKENIDNEENRLLLLRVQ